MSAGTTWFVNNVILETPNVLPTIAMAQCDNVVMSRKAHFSLISMPETKELISGLLKGPGQEIQVFNCTNSSRHSVAINHSLYNISTSVRDQCPVKLFTLFRVQFRSSSLVVTLSQLALASPPAALQVRRRDQLPQAAQRSWDSSSVQYAQTCNGLGSLLAS